MSPQTYIIKPSNKGLARGVRSRFHYDFTQKNIFTEKPPLSRSNIMFIIVVILTLYGESTEALIKARGSGQVLCSTLCRAPILIIRPSWYPLSVDIFRQLLYYREEKNKKKSPHTRSL